MPWRRYINTCVSSYGRVSVNYPAPFARVLSPKAGALVESLALQAKQQTDQRNELEHRLKQVATGLTTSKQLAEALPEFAKYLPVDAPTALRSLPTITGTVDLFKAAGWPGR